MSDKKYNIVLINPDQMRWDYMTPNGHPFIETKHLSRLAEMGTNFDHAFCPSPMCGPSRTSMLTGQYPCEHGVRDYGGNLNPSLPNALQSLKDAGYHRALFGKQHVIVEDAIGVHYDEGEDNCIGNMDDHPDYVRSWSSGTLEADSPWNVTERLTTAGLDYIERRNQSSEPFFLTLNFQDPHPYFTAPAPYDTLFSPDQFELPENFRRESVDGEPQRISHWRANSRSSEASEDDFKKAMAMYCGQIRYVDDQVGRVLDKLEALNILDETIVLFWSDHGEFLGDYGVTHKLAAFYDSMVRVPVILWDPSDRIAKGNNSSMVETPDMLATILDLCGVPQPEGSRAQSLSNDSYAPRIDAFAEGGTYLTPLEQPIEGVNLRAPHSPSQFGPGSMLRTDKWKLCTHSFDCWELYDLENDPNECNNLINAPEHAERVRTLSQRLMQRMLCQGQAPEHLPKPKCTSLDAEQMPIWEGH